MKLDYILSNFAKHQNTSVFLKLPIIIKKQTTFFHINPIIVIINFEFNGQTSDLHMRTVHQSRGPDID